VAESYDAVVIGGGFYGAAVAAHLSERWGLARIALVERERELLTRASYRNQARIHNGYHYPRSFTTAYRSRINLPRFVKDFPDSVKSDFTKVYAIARRNSKVTARQFRRFCEEIGAKLAQPPASVRALFDAALIEDVFLVEEYAFDAVALRRMASESLAAAGVEVLLGQDVRDIRAADGKLVVECGNGASPPCRLTARLVFNCTYSGLNQFGGDFPGTQLRLKHEITELALVVPPPELAGVGVTVMDGPFFSIMPFPARGLHSLSHVRYTPHLQWLDEPGVDPDRRLREYDKVTRADRMVRDSARYLPAVREAEYVESLFEVKTVLVKNEGDDGRPILFERHPALPNCFSILGGKIDNIYDVLERLDAALAESH
jgi:glycine/D-amino acid oxidase-like deaminating enzyme